MVSKRRYCFIGLSFFERPILDHDAKAHNFEICQISWNPVDFMWISHEIWQFSYDERGYNPETPCNFSHHSRVISTGWHTHLSYDWWRLPSGEAALASPCWKAPSNSSLDWTIVGVTLGPDSEVSVWVLGAQCWG